MTSSRFIEWEKFEDLEKKYSQRSNEFHKIERALEELKKKLKLTFGAIIFKDGERIYFNKTIGGIYINSNRIKNRCCYVCGKKRKTTKHHLIPTRLKKDNKLGRLIIRVCRECEDKIHPENGFSRDEILNKQRTQMERLRKQIEVKAQDLLKPIEEIINPRILQLEIECKHVPKYLKAKPRLIHPTLCRLNGRIEELKRFKRILMMPIAKALDVKVKLSGRQNEIM